MDTNQIKPSKEAKPMSHRITPSGLRLPSILTGMIVLTGFGPSVPLAPARPRPSPSPSAPASPSTGTWAAVPNMAVARSRHTATCLLDGRVLVVGGITAEAFRTAELYDPATDSWTPAGSLSRTRSEHVAVRLLDGRVLVAGANWADPTAELYDLTTNSWTPTGSMNVGRNDFTATLLPDGRVLVVGGQGHDCCPNILDSAELYDPAAGTWTLTGSLRVRRWRHTATLLPNGTVLVAGGISDGSIGRPSGAEIYEAFPRPSSTTRQRTDGR